MTKNVTVGKYTVKPQCGPGECAYFETCQTLAGRTRLASQIVDAVEVNDTRLLPQHVLDGKGLKERPEDPVCLHLPRLIAATLPYMDQRSLSVRQKRLWSGLLKVVSALMPQLTNQELISTLD